MENWHSDSLKKVKLSLSQGKKKKGYEFDDEDDDDVVRTSVSQDRALLTPFTEPLFLGNQYI